MIYLLGFGNCLETEHTNYKGNNYTSFFFNLLKFKFFSDIKCCHNEVLARYTDIYSWCLSRRLMHTALRTPVCLSVSSSVRLSVCNCILYSIEGTGICIYVPWAKHFRAVLASTLIYMWPWPCDPGVSQTHYVTCIYIFSV